MRLPVDRVGSWRRVRLGRRAEARWRVLLVGRRRRCPGCEVAQCGANTAALREELKQHRHTVRELKRTLEERAAAGETNRRLMSEINRMPAAVGMTESAD